MPRISPIKARRLIGIIEELGFSPVRQKGSHAFFRHPDGRTTTIPIHPREEIGRGLLRKILRDVNLSVGDFNRLREKT